MQYKESYESELSKLKERIAELEARSTEKKDSSFFYQYYYKKLWNCNDILKQDVAVLD